MLYDLRSQKKSLVNEIEVTTEEARNTNIVDMNKHEELYEI